MSQPMRWSFAIAFLFLFVAIPARADDFAITPTYALNGVITVTGFGSNPPVQTIDVMFNFAFFQNTNFGDILFAHVMPGPTSFTSFGALGSSSGASFGDFQTTDYPWYIPLPFGGGELDLTAGYSADPHDGIGAYVYSCPQGTLCDSIFHSPNKDSLLTAFTYTVTQVPEPRTFALTCAGLVLLIALKKLGAPD